MVVVGLIRKVSSRQAGLAQSDQPDRTLDLSEVIEVRKGTDADPDRPDETGTAVLRRNCTEDDLVLSFSLITNTR